MPETSAQKPSRHTKEIISIALILFSLFALIALFTYNVGDYPDYKFPANETTHNKGGSIGAFLSNELFFFFGLASYIIILMLGFWGVILLLRKKITALAVKIIALVLFLTAAITMAGLVTPADYSSPRMHTYGGVAGDQMAQITVNYFGSIGSYILALFILIGSVLLATDWLAYDILIRGGKLGRKIFGGMFKGIKSLMDNLKKDRQRDQMLKQYQQQVTMPPVKTVQATPITAPAVEKPVIAPMPIPKPEPTISKAAVPEPKEDKAKPPAKEKSAAPAGKSNYRLPFLELLEDAVPVQATEEEKDIKERIDIIEGSLRNFGIEARVVNVERGPVVTKYELELAPGVSVHKIAGMTDDLSIALKSTNVMVVAPIPGKSTVGVEVPNRYQGVVRLKELIQSSREKINSSPLPFFMGKDAAGTAIVRDIDEMPHMLIAGTTGSGKSVCVASLVLSLVMHRTPDELKLLMIDPKMVELSVFKELPHLISPVVTDMRRAPIILKWLCRTMDERYELFLRVGVKKIETYNQLSESKIREKLTEDGEEPGDVPLKLPYIVVLIDELADLMMAASDDVETAITRLAQKSRAVGIHLVLATQRPSVDVITGLIKSNMPSRVAFKVASKIDSRTILDRNGAERLLGKGDMLALFPSTTDLTRGQCTFVSDKEIHSVVDFWKDQGEPVYDAELLEIESKQDFTDTEQDELFDQAAQVILESKRGSVSLIQRRLNIGYSRAARLIEMMAKVGIVGDYKNSKAREVIMTPQEWENNKQRRS
ncbi:MAG: DNA translocase FtsK 4TM domain-containing protein [Candidatus Brocadiia bacterium]